MQVHYFLLVAAVAVQLAPTVSGAKMLFMFGLAGKSHTHVFNALATELATKGHEITVVTPFPIKNPPKNYKQIDAPMARESMKEMDAYSTSKQNVFQVMGKLIEIFSTLCPNVLNIPEVQKLKEEKFDLVFVSIFFNDCCYPFSRHFNAPLILLSPVGLISWTSDSIGNPEQYSYVPSIFLPFGDHMSFLERIVNVSMNLCLKVLRAILFTPKLTAAAREFFGDDIPPLEDIASNTSLVLINNHISINYPRPLLPSVIEVGGMHIKPSIEKLPKVRFKKIK